MFAFVSAFPKSLHCTDEAQQAETVLSAVLSIYIYIYMIRKEGSQNKLQAEKNPRRERARAETRTYGTDSPSRLKSPVWIGLHVLEVRPRAVFF